MQRISKTGLSFSTRGLTGFSTAGLVTFVASLLGLADGSAQNSVMPAYPQPMYQSTPAPAVTPPQPSAAGQRPSFLLQTPTVPPNAGTYTAPVAAPTYAPPPTTAPAANGQRPSFLPSSPQSQYPTPVSGYEPLKPVPVPSTAQPQTLIQKIEIPYPNSVSAPINPAGAAAPTDALPTPPPSAPTIVYDQGSPGSPAEAGPTPEPTPAPLDPGQLLQQKQYAELLPIIESERNSPLAAAVGWSLYNDNQIDSAKQYFVAALNYDDANYEAAYGLALSLVRQNQFDKAEQVARWRVAEYPQMNNILGDIDNSRAIRAYQAGDYKKTLALYEQVKTYRTLSRNEQVVMAWSAFHLGDLTTAATEFERLYAEQPDTYAAQGIYATLSKQKNWSGLEALAKKYGGPLEPMYQKYVGQRYYDAGLYANAVNVMPKSFKGNDSLDGYTSDSMHALMYGRYKTGDSGMSQLTEFRGMIGGSMWMWGTSKFTLNVSATSLSAGNLPAGSDVGTVPFEGPTKYIYSPITRYNTLFDFLVAWQAEGFYTPYAALGITPAGALVAPALIGNLGVKAIQEWGTWSAEAFRDPKKESILSYVGLRDPYTGVAYGRVVESGARLSAYAPIRDNWALSGTILGGFLDGENVQDNSHFMISGNLNYNFKNPNFEYLTLGPLLAYESYSNNLSYFTYGQGGYFSPQYWVRGALGTQFQTHQGGSWLIRGSAAIGAQSYAQDETPFFPLSNSDATFTATEAQTFTAYVDLEGMVQLGNQFMLGGHLLLNKTGDYTEGWAGIYLRYFFEPRGGIYSTDFLEFNRF